MSTFVVEALRAKLNNPRRIPEHPVCEYRRPSAARSVCGDVCAN